MMSLMLVAVVILLALIAASRVARTEFFSGLSQGGVRIIDSRVTTGNVFFVDSGSATGGDTSGFGNSPDRPFLTLDFAIGQCTANNGDIIYVLPGHAENLASAGAIACDVAGVRIIGLGHGSDRPTFTWSNTAGTWAISAANVTVENIRCTVSVDEVVKLFHVTAAYCTLDKVDFFETATKQAIQFLLTSALADFLTAQNCYHCQTTAANSAQLWIELVGLDNARIMNNTFILALHNGATDAVINASTAVINCQIAHNTILQTGGTTQVSAILLASTSTGFVHDNRIAAAVTTLAGTVALASAYGAENYTLNTANKSGILDPVADS